MRSAMRAASCYLEGGPLMWMLPLYLHVNQKSDYEDDDNDQYHVSYFFQPSFPKLADPRTIFSQFC